MAEEQPLPRMQDAGTKVTEWIALDGSRIRRITQWLQIGTGLVLVVVATTGLAYSAFHPVVEFAAGGARVQFRDRWGSGSSGGVNTVVPVLYDPRVPSVALIDRPVLNWMPWGPTMAVGLFLVVVGASGKRGDRKRQA